jgi:hypothetical protein
MCTRIKLEKVWGSMRKEERHRGQEYEEEEVSSYWITLNKQRRLCVLKFESTRLQSIENSIWKWPCLCRKTDFAYCLCTVINPTALFHFQSVTRTKRSEGRIEIVRGGTITAYGL